MKKLISWLLTAGVLVSCLTGIVGCGIKDASDLSTQTSTEDSQTASSESGNKEIDNKELNIAIFQGGFGADYWYAVVPKFEEANPGVTVNMSINPKIGEIIRTQIVSGDAPDFISLTDTDASGLTLSMIKERGLLDLTDLFNSKALDRDTTVKDMILDGVLESKKFAPYGDGKIYLAPFSAGPLGLVYNKTLFEQKGWKVPETWDEFFTLTKELKKEENYVRIDGKKQKRALFTYPGIYPSYLEILLYTGIANSPDGINKLTSMFNYEENSFSNDAVKNTLGIFEKIAQGDNLMKGTVALNHTQSQADMMIGKSLFIPNGLWMEGEMKDSPREEGFQFGMIAPPRYNKGETRYIESMVEQFSIPAKAKNPELAKEFLKFLYTDESVKLFAEKANGVYALKQARELSKDALTKNGTVNSFVYDSYEVYETAKAIIPNWKAQPKGSKSIVMDEIFTKNVTPYLNGKITEEQWMANVEKTFATIRAEQAAAK